MVLFRNFIYFLFLHLCMMKSRIIAILDKWELCTAQYITVMLAGGGSNNKGGSEFDAKFLNWDRGCNAWGWSVKSRGISRNLAKKLFEMKSI